MTSARVEASSEPVLLSWSTGKDSAWCLHVLRESGARVAGLLCTVNEAFQRVAMHGVRRELLLAQAEAVGLPLWEVPIPNPCSNSAYEAAMAGVLERARRAGIRAVAFGDLFLEDIRRYRERMMARTGIVPRFPLWGEPTGELARRMIDAGVRAKVVCVDLRHLAPSFAGREFDRGFLADLPPGADPCGERGEFHTFVYDGPVFSRPIPVAVGEVVQRDGFGFADLCRPAAPKP